MDKFRNKAFITKYLSEQKKNQYYIRFHEEKPLAFVKITILFNPTKIIVIESFAF